MKRDITRQLMRWKESHRRKPLILRGARQVGKTWILKDFGNRFPDGAVYINFEKEPAYKEFFSQTKDIGQILSQLALATGKKITAQTLLILDEIGECPDALNCLKYFCEDRPELFVAAAGSLLGLDLAKGFPVGKVNYLEMYPMTFSEFLSALGEDSLREYMESICQIEAIPALFFSRFTQRLREYFFVGGMPEAVASWCEYQDAAEIDEILQEILFAYERDMGKHPEKSDVPKVHYLWDSIPSQLARENKKFLYSAAKNGARAREYENALNWLVNADMVKKVYAVTKPGLPVSAYEDLAAFKIYMGDIGLLRKKSVVGYEAFLKQSDIFTEFKGAFTENYVLQSLIPSSEAPIHYWKDSRYEVDFILQKDNDIIPVETKSGKSVKTPGMKHYGQYYQPRLMLRASMRNLSFDGEILNIPLFLISEWRRLIGKFE